MAGKRSSDDGGVTDGGGAQSVSAFGGRLGGTEYETRVTGGAGDGSIAGSNAENGDPCPTIVAPVLAPSLASVPLATEGGLTAARGGGLLAV